MRKLLMLTAAFVLALSSCDKDDDNNNNNGGSSNVPSSYDGNYKGDALYDESGVLGDTTFTEEVTIRIQKDADGHFMYGYTVERDDSSKVYFNNSGFATFTDELNQLGTVTKITQEAQINGTKLEIDASVVVNVPAAQVVLSTSTITGTLDKQ
jgi:hypothetical protein